jgi:hypothetical protein
MLFSLLLIFSSSVLQRETVPGMHVLVSELPTPLPADVAMRVGEVKRRHATAMRMAKFPTVRGERSMVIASQMNYEISLFAVGRGPSAAADANALVKLLQPCYEWEGGADCPRREAEALERVLATSHTSLRSLGHFLPLHTAHRWMCVAEYSAPSASSEEARGRANTLFARAAASDDALVRAAAVALQRRGKCFP